MGFRYRKTVRVSKRTRVNIGIRKASVSVGEPGLTVNLSRRGARATVGIPGTGLSYSTKQAGGSRRRGSLIEELLAVIFIVLLLGLLRAIWRGLAGLAVAVFGSRSEPSALAQPQELPGDHVPPAGASPQESRLGEFFADAPPENPHHRTVAQTPDEREFFDRLKAGDWGPGHRR